MRRKPQSQGPTPQTPIPHPLTPSPPRFFPPKAGSLAAHLRRNQGSWVIVKPDGGCQGKGIVLTDDPRPVCSGFDGAGPSSVAQKYVDRPFLIDNLKFDLRIYVLITSCEPLRVYLYEEGIARFCTSPYARPDAGNAKQTYMHLTNWAINKKNQVTPPRALIDACVLCVCLSEQTRVMPPRSPPMDGTVIRPFA